MGALRNPIPAASRTMHRGSGWTLEGSGAPLCRVRVLWTTASPGPLQRLHREGSGPREPRSSPAPRKPEWASKRIPIPRCLADGWSPLSRGSPRGRQHKHSSVLYSPPN